jgi:hypothetical protein
MGAFAGCIFPLSLPAILIDEVELKEVHHFEIVRAHMNIMQRSTDVG